MDWLNYHHLRYFWAVAREGSIARASKLLHVSQPSISTQLRQLERFLGETLLQRHGRGLQLTDMGRFVLGYAEQIFSLGRDMLDAVRDQPTGQPLRLQVGITDVIPKHLSYRLLGPLMTADSAVRLVVHEDRPDRLLAELAVYGLDVVIADVPAAVGTKVRAFHHPLGSSAVGVFGPRRTVAPLRRGFPESLRDRPFVLPLEHAELRREFEVWMRDRGIRVRIVAEVEDSALQNTFAHRGAGLILAPTVLAADLAAAYGLASCGELPGLMARYFAITVDRRVKHPALAALLRTARSGLFARDEA